MPRTTDSKKQGQDIEWISTKEWAERRGVNPSYARKLVRLEKLPHKSTPGPGPGGRQNLVPAGAEPERREPVHDEETRAKWREAKSQSREKLSEMQKARPPILRLGPG